MKLFHGLVATAVLALGTATSAAGGSVGRQSPPPEDGGRQALGQEVRPREVRPREVRREPLGPAATPRPPTGRYAPAGSYAWPSGGAVPVLRGFDPPSVKWGRGHRGVDLAMQEGQPVMAAGDGVVLYAGRLADRPTVSIEHAGGIRTTYEPVEPAVAAGQSVARGQVIGTLKGGHCGANACLHWGAKRGPDDYLTPLRLVRPLIRLLE